MSTAISPDAGQPATATPTAIIDVSQLVSAYYTLRPDPTVVSQRVAFGTSGHRGCALEISFNEWHVLAITQAICDQRRRVGIAGPLYAGVDTHAVSAAACASALEVLAANDVDVMLAIGDEATPTPAVSHAIVKHNRRLWDAGGEGHRADGIIFTPSHNPPRDGGIKYNPPHGGPAAVDVTGRIQASANAYLERQLRGVRRLPHKRALRSTRTHRHDYRNSYVAELDQVIDLAAIRQAGVHMGVDPLGGAGIAYWSTIAERWRLILTVISELVDPTFAFMTLDWDGKIRMDPSSPYAMQRLILRKEEFDIAFACDTDHDRHGIVSPAHGLLAPNHYLCCAIDYLFGHRPSWAAYAGVGKTVVSTQLIDRVTQRLGRQLYEVPVGFKWFAPSLLSGRLAFAGEESAGASFVRRDGSVWTTDKDGIIAALLSAEITAVLGRDPATLYADLTAQLGSPLSRVVVAPATATQRQRLSALSRQAILATELAGERVASIQTRAPGNNAELGGIKVSTAWGWFAARPSGTEDTYKIYAESFRDEAHLKALLHEAQGLVDQAIGFP